MESQRYLGASVTSEAPCASALAPGPSCAWASAWGGPAGPGGGPRGPDARTRAGTSPHASPQDGADQVHLHRRHRVLGAEPPTPVADLVARQRDRVAPAVVARQEQVPVDAPLAGL